MILNSKEKELKLIFRTVYRKLRMVCDSALTRFRHPTTQIIQAASPDGKTYFSQLGQDRYFEKYIVPQQATGTFVDIGCNHPIKGNNSFWLESHGWTGIAIDPIQRFAKEWEVARKTPFICGGVDKEPSERWFIEFQTIDGWEHELSAFEDFVKPAHLRDLVHNRFRVAAGPISYHAPWMESVNLLLIDVEGAELIVLQGIGLDHFRPRWILIENNRRIAGDERIRTFLQQYGYQLTARIAGTDDFYERHLEKC